MKKNSPKLKTTYTVGDFYLVEKSIWTSFFIDSTMKETGIIIIL